MTDMKRMRVIISGRVQGVFFRANTQKAARDFHLNGWVRNLRDGRVEAVFEGEAMNCAAMLRWCKKGPPFAVVENIDVEEEQYTGEFDDFRIVY
jgi:acylphosphatase